MKLYEKEKNANLVAGDKKHIELCPRNMGYVYTAYLAWVLKT